VRNFKKQIKIKGEKFQKTDQNLTKTNKKYYNVNQNI